MLYIYKYIQKIYACVTIQEYKETHCTTTIHKQNTQVMFTSTTMHTQHKYFLQFRSDGELQFRSDGEKDEFLKHF